MSESNLPAPTPDLSPAVNEETPLAALFAKDPLKITKDEFARIVAFYREERKRLMISDAEGKPAKTKKAPSKGLSLADLGLGGIGGLKL